MTHLDKHEWIVQPIPLDDAVRQIQAWHYAKDYDSHAIYSHGLFRREDGWFGARCWGAALWLNAVYLSKRFGLPAGPMMLTRLVLDPEAPTNAASFLIRRSAGLIDRTKWPVLVSYADTAQNHSGAIYQAAGWTYDGDGGHLTYLHPETGRQMSSFGPGGRFVPCPAGWETRQSVKRRFIHQVPYAVAASSDAPVYQTGEGSSQLTLPLHTPEVAA